MVHLYQGVGWGTEGGYYYLIVVGVFLLMLVSFVVACPLSLFFK